MRPLQIAIGFDPRETIAASVLSHSIQRRARSPVAISYVSLRQLPWWKRPRDPLQSNDFSFTRFLVPYLYGYCHEPVLFLDADMLCLAPIDELFERFNANFPVSCVQHEYVPRKSIKYLNNSQTAYRFKNWTSVMLFAPSLCDRLTPEYVERASGLDLHQFRWLEGEHQMGELPKCWNYLVDEDNQCPREEAKLVHYTNGGPYFREYAGCEFSTAWFLEKDDMERCDQRVAA